MKNSRYFLLVIYSFSLKSQTPFSGIVTEQNSGYKAIPNVQVMSEAANKISSDVKGNFNLSFQNKKEGDEIYLQAEKAGYEIVNAKEMATKIPKKQINPFKIVMCKSGLLAQNKAKYYEISEKHITQKYEKELAKLNRSTEGWREKAAKLEENFRSSLEFARELANRYSMMNLDDVSELQRKAFRLYEENKVDEALKILEGENYQANIKQVKAEQKKIQDNTQLADNEIAKAEEIIQQQISKLMFQADLYAQDFQIEKAERTYEIAVEADTSNFKNSYNFAYFLANQNKYDKAIFYNKRALKTTKEKPEVGRINNNLGVLYEAKNNHSSALEAYVKALEIFEELSKNDSNTFEPYIAGIQENLGTLYITKNEYQSAMKALIRALAIYDVLVKIKPQIYEPEIAGVLTNFGSLCKAQNNYPDALKSYTNALGIYERLAIKNPNTFRPNIAIVQDNLGNLYQDTKDNVSAMFAYQKSLGIRESLAIKNPDVYEPQVAKTLNNLVSLYYINNDFSSALTACTKALEIRKRLAIKNPDTYEPDIALTLNNLGMLYQSQNDFSSAFTTFLKSFEIYERISIKNPEAYEVEFCRTIVLLGYLQKAYYEELRQEQINAYLLKAKEVLPKYADVPFAQTLLGFVNELEDYFGNIKDLSKIQDLQSQIEKTEKYSEKIKFQKEIIEKYQYLVDNNNLKFAIDLGSSLSGLAWYQIFEKKFAEAEKLANEALNPIKFKKTEDYDAKIEWANTNLALSLLFQGKYAEAEKIYAALKDKPYNNATYRETFLADLEELEKAGITHLDVIKIREILGKR